MRTPAVLAGLLACCAFVGCAPVTDDSSLIWVEAPTALDKINAPGGVFQRATRGVFVDPRSPKLYEESHIPGAISLPLPDMTDTAATVLAGYNLYVVYDSDYSDVMARAGSKRLLELGFKDVFTLQGGLRGWKKDGYDVVAGTKPNK